MSASQQIGRRPTDRSSNSWTSLKDKALKSIQRTSSLISSAVSRTEKFDYCDKRLIINEYEADILRRIFQYYDEGKSSLYISDVLNSEEIPSPYKIRIEEAVARRKAKGLPEKKYTTFAGYENMKWRPSTINRLIKNPLYIGKRDFKFYEPDPANPLPTHLREGRKLLQDFSVQAEDLRIIDEAQFRRVNEMVTEKAFNRNLGVRHVNLLKDLMHCGECGGHYSVSGGTAERKYRCYGTVNRLDKPKTCDKGTDD